MADSQPLLWIGPRRGCRLFYSLACAARRVAGYRSSSVIPRKALRVRTHQNQLPLPIHVSLGGFGHAQCVRLRDGRFHVFQPGTFPALLTGPDHILADTNLAGLLQRLCGPALFAMPAEVIHLPTGQNLAEYFELSPQDEVTPDTLRQIDASGIGVWHFAHSHLFVTDQIAVELRAAGYERLRYASGFRGVRWRNERCIASRCCGQTRVAGLVSCNRRSPALRVVRQRLSSVIRLGARMYWRWRSIPEVAALSDEESRDLWRRALNAPGRLPDIFWAWLLSFCFAASLWSIGYWLARFPTPVIYSSFCLLAVFIYCLGRVAALWYLRVVAKRIRAGI